MARTPDTPGSPSDTGSRSTARSARLKDALRTNLVRRKQQARARHEMVEDEGRAGNTPGATPRAPGADEPVGQS